jgi:hypothetical protein
MNAWQPPPLSENELFDMPKPIVYLPLEGGTL